MLRLLYICLCIAFVVGIICSGCSPHPKFRRGENAAENENNQTSDRNDRLHSELEGKEYSGVNTGQLLELGRVIQSFLGRPYSGNSRSGNGLDCSQFTCRVYEKFDGTVLPRTASEQFEFGKRINKGDIRYGDLVFFRTEGHHVSHVGIYVGYDEFVHSSSSSGVIISSIKDKYWKKRFVGGRRIIP